MVVSLLVVASLGYLAVVALAFFSQRALLFPAPPSVEPLGARSRQVTLAETVLLVRPPPAPEARLVLHFHGNGEQLGWVEWMADRWEAHGVGFVAVEYPGYGLAREQGSPSEASIVAAADAAVKWIEKELKVAPERLILSGQSLGTGVAMTLASRGVGERVILLSPYTSLPDVGACAMPFLPVRLLMRDRFDSLEKAPRVRQPVLVIHGKQDEVVPFDLGAQLAGALPSARLLAVDGAGHNDLAGRPEVWSAVLPFATGD